ncbi:hypothetical protein [Campylobacter hyointestinalis]|nr:hypothetical protein [Campylobacter hyointestinalis]
MYESLKKHSLEFHLFIFAFDDESGLILNSLDLTNVTIIGLKEFENKELLELKKHRKIAEYCWTCTPFVIDYCIKKYNLKSCTYLDADLYFFANPNVLIDEMLNSSVLITEHRYTPIYDQSATSGIYCVQFMTFKNDLNGLKALHWWKNACLDWCYDRLEEGKFGDQKYLDDWNERFEGVHVLKNIGGGVAPWNIQQYIFLKEKNKVIGIQKSDFYKFDLIFYHFHGLKFLENDNVELGNYILKKTDLKFIYKPYLETISAINQDLKLKNLFESQNKLSNIKFNCKILLKNIKRMLKKSYNIYKQDYILGL